MSLKSAKKLKLTPAAGTLQRKFKSAAALRFLDDERVVVAMIGEAASKEGGERCSIVSLADEKETVIDPQLYARNPGMLAFDPNRQRILFALVGDLTLFDAKTGAALTRFQTGGKHVVQVACFSPDGALACVGTSAKIDVWDTAGEHGAPNEVVPHLTKDMPQGTPAHSFQPEGPRVAARFSPDGALLALSMSSLEDGTGVLRLWSTRDEQFVATAKWQDPITSFDFSPDGQSIFVVLTTARLKFGKRGAGQGRVDVVDLHGKTVHGWKAGGEILDVRFLPSGPLVTIDDKSLLLMDPGTGEVLAKRAQKAAIRTPEIADVRGRRVLMVGPMGLFAVE